MGEFCGYKSLHCRCWQSGYGNCGGCQYHKKCIYEFMDICFLYYAGLYTLMNGQLISMKSFIEVFRWVLKVYNNISDRKIVLE